MSLSSPITSWAFAILSEPLKLMMSYHSFMIGLLSGLAVVCCLIFLILLRQRELRRIHSLSCNPAEPLNPEKVQDPSQLS